MTPSLKSGKVDLERTPRHDAAAKNHTIMNVAEKIDLGQLALPKPAPNFEKLNFQNVTVREMQDYLQYFSSLSAWMSWTGMRVLAREGFLTMSESLLLLKATHAIASGMQGNPVAFRLYATVLERSEASFSMQLADLSDKHSIPPADQHRDCKNGDHYLWTWILAMEEELRSETFYGYWESCEAWDLFKLLITQLALAAKSMNCRSLVRDFAIDLCPYDREEQNKFFVFIWGGPDAATTD